MLLRFCAKQINVSFHEKMVKSLFTTVATICYDRADKENREQNRFTI